MPEADRPQRPRQMDETGAFVFQFPSSSLCKLMFAHISEPLPAGPIHSPGASQAGSPGVSPAGRFHQGTNIITTTFENFSPIWTRLRKASHKRQAQNGSKLSSI